MNVTCAVGRKHRHRIGSVSFRVEGVAWEPEAFLAIVSKLGCLGLDREYGRSDSFALISVHSSRISEGTVLIVNFELKKRFGEGCRHRSL